MRLLRIEIEVDEADLDAVAWAIEAPGRSHFVARSEIMRRMHDAGLRCVTNAREMRATLEQHVARKHAKKFKQKQPVERITVKPAVVSRERIVTEVPAGTEGAIPVKQDDGTEKFFVVSFKEVSPAVVKVRALGPTTTRGLRNDPKGMAPKGVKMSKTAPTGGKK